MDNYTVKSPVLFLIFNRPDTTAQVFNKIREVKPSILYLAADGARANLPDEELRCKQARKIINQIDWECEVKTLFRTENQGCRLAVSSAITWFFEQEEEGIILEDDCLPSTSFFHFCDEMLKRYRYDTRVRHISGTNLQSQQQWAEASYYFHESTIIWGWASWRRVWKDYDSELTRYTLPEVESRINKIFDDQFLAQQWLEIFKALKQKQIDTWDYQLAFLNYFNHGLSISPNRNLVSNIGFRPDATHTPDPNNQFANLKTSELGQLIHPKYILPEKQIDYNIFAKEFKLEERSKKHYSIRRRFKRWIKGK
ncbi:nucleotide-diphospho-sugar transferase [Pedobacter sp. JCM 36344]|uniref:nucleotide-diphospho-sugar transferase n=1 Tax=Pedobacter sp. JCM 36344 TaxID=3374280 RepID=UPI00397886C5